MYGRAKVPTTPRVPDPEEADALVVERPVVVVRPSKPISWQRASRASLRSLTDGWGPSFTGFLIAFSGWGVWADAGRGSIASPLTGLVFMLLVAVGVFALCRLLGYVVLTQMLNRRRLHARWAHLATGLFLTLGGISYFANTRLVISTDEWIQGLWEWVNSLWERI